MGKISIRSNAFTQLMNECTTISKKYNTGDVLKGFYIYPIPLAGNDNTRVYFNLTPNQVMVEAIDNLIEPIMDPIAIDLIMDSEELHGVSLSPTIPESISLYYLLPPTLILPPLPSAEDGARFLEYSQTVTTAWKNYETKLKEFACIKCVRPDVKNEAFRESEAFFEQNYPPNDSMIDGIIQLPPALLLISDKDAMSLTRRPSDKITSRNRPNSNKRN